MVLLAGIGRHLLLRRSFCLQRHSATARCADVLSVNYAQEYRTHGAYVRSLTWALGGLRRHDFGALFTPAKSFRRNATEDDSATRRRLVNKIVKIASLPTGRRY